VTGPETSLDRLHDIVVPEPPPLWPPAPGVWVVLVVVLCVVLALILWWRRARARNEYRRAGLALLAGALTSREVNVILKRVALAAFPRPRVAPLYGDEWFAFLDSTCSRAHFTAIAPIDPATEVSPELRTMAGTWIRHHRATAVGAQSRES
jgi:hypothetical protein